MALYEVNLVLSLNELLQSGWFSEFRSIKFCKKSYCSGELHCSTTKSKIWWDFSNLFKFFKLFPLQESKFLLRYSNAHRWNFFWDKFTSLCNFILFWLVSETGQSQVEILLTNSCLHFQNRQPTKVVRRGGYKFLNYTRPENWK